MELFNKDTKVFCRLCLGNTNDENFKLIEVIKGIFEVLQFTLIGLENGTFVICRACSTKLFAAFDFKAVCTDTEDCIFPYIDSGSGAPIDLREIYLKERGKEHLREILQAERICRLCMQVAGAGSCEFTSVEKMNIDSLRIFIPEENFNFTEEPVVCKVCLDSLDTHTRFLKSCANVEQKIKDISYYEVPESPFRISTEKIEIKSEESCSDTPLPNLKHEPIDCTSGCTDTSSSSDCEDVKEDIKDICDDSAIETRSSIKCEDVEIKSEEDYSHTSLPNLKHEPIDCRSGCANTSSTSDCEEVKEDIKGICDDRAMESLSSKCEDVEIRSKENCSDISKGKLQGGPVDCISKCQPEHVNTTNNSTLKHKRKRHESGDGHNLLKNKISVEKQIYKCHSCDYETTTKDYLKKHVVKHNVPKEKIYKCDFCDYRTDRKINLWIHRYRHKDIPEERVYKCDWCNYKTIYKKCLKPHQRIHKAIPEEQMYKCDFCDFKTIYKRSIAGHQLTHKDIPEEEMYKCDSCDYRTDRKRNLTRHQDRHKDIPEEQMYKCDSCEFKTTSKRYLGRHQLRHRDIPEEQMFRCDLCDFKSVYKRSVMEHQLVHKDIPEEEMYKCDSCDYRTHKMKNLKRHQIRHKDIPEDQMYKCAMCDFKTIYKDFLRIHLRRQMHFSEDVLK